VQSFKRGRNKCITLMHFYRKRRIPFQSMFDLFYIAIFYNSINYFITVVIEIARIINQANLKLYI